MKTEIKIKIFTEGSEKIGFGHLSRCAALYDEAIRQGFSAELFIQTCDYDFTANSILSNRRYSVDNWQSKKYLQKNLDPNDYCIVDSYLATLEIYEEVSKKSRKALYVDDYARIDYPRGIIVNPSLSTDGLYYPQKLDREYLLGRDYIILRTPFLNKKKSYNPKIKRILITMGGTDIIQLTDRITCQLAPQFPKISFDIVFGKNSGKLVELKHCDNIKVYNNLTDNEMCDLMLKSDFAITAAGQTIYELLALEIPFLAIQTAENQNNNINSLKKLLKKEWYITFDENNLLKRTEEAFQKIVDCPSLERQKGLVHYSIDGLGSERMIKKLINEKPVIIFKKVSFSDCDLLFRWANDVDVRENAFNTESIMYENHVAWLKRKTTEILTEMFIVYVDEKPIGQIRIEMNDFGEGEISYSIDKGERGKGYGSLLLSEIVVLFANKKEHKVNCLTGKVKFNNIASQKAFLKANFIERKTEDYWIYSYEFVRQN